MAAAPHTETIRGPLTSLRVLTADGFGRGSVETEASGPSGFPRIVTVVGKLLTVRVGDTVECVGVHIEHPQYGAQFKVSSCMPVQPKTSEGTILWMSARLPDIGAARARALVEHFGDGLWSTIEADPMALCVVTGITAERAQAIANAYRLVAHERENMCRLRGWGLTERQITTCIAAWGDVAVVIERIRSDPYELASVVDGFGFKRADRVAQAMGIRPDAPARIRAGILYVLDSGAKNEGHCFIWGGKLREVAAALLGVDTQLVIAQIFAVCEMNRAVRRGARVYASKLDRAEAQCAEAIKLLLGRA